MQTFSFVRSFSYCNSGGEYEALNQYSWITINYPNQDFSQEKPDLPSFVHSSYQLLLFYLEYEYIQYGGPQSRLSGVYFIIPG